MSIEYIRNYYGIEVKRGCCCWVSVDGKTLKGHVTVSKGARLRVRLQGERKSRIFHPLDVNPLASEKI